MKLQKNETTEQEIASNTKGKFCKDISQSWISGSD